MIFVWNGRLKIFRMRNLIEYFFVVGVIIKKKCIKMFLRWICEYTKCRQKRNCRKVKRKEYGKREEKMLLGQHVKDNSMGSTLYKNEFIFLSLLWKRSKILYVTKFARPYADSQLFFIRKIYNRNVSKENSLFFLDVFILIWFCQIHRYFEELLSRNDWKLFVRINIFI